METAMCAAAVLAGSLGWELEGPPPLPTFLSESCPSLSRLVESGQHACLLTPGLVQLVGSPTPMLVICDSGLPGHGDPLLQGYASNATLAKPPALR